MTTPTAGTTKENAMPKASTNLRLAAAADLKGGTTTINLGVDPDQCSIRLQIRQGDDIVSLQLDDDAAHRLGVDLIEAARRLTTYGDDD